MNQPLRTLGPFLLLVAALLLVACGSAAGDTPTPSQSAGALPTNTALPPVLTDTVVAPTALPPTATVAAPTAVPPTATVAAPTDTAVTLPTVTTGPPTVTAGPPTVAPLPPTVAAATPLPPTVAPPTARPATHTPLPPTHVAAATPAPTSSSPPMIVGTSVAGGGPVTSPPLRDITPLPPGGLAVTVTAAASGEATLDLPLNNRPTVQLQSGQRLRLNLGAGYDWTISGDTGPILVAGNGGINPAVRLYTARQAGTVALQITADPTCRQATTPCERPSYFYTIPVIVR